MQDPKKIEEAKKMAAGLLGNKMAKFPLLFAKAVFFGQRPSKTQPSEINNGTITLVNLGKGPFFISCHHVLECYRKKLVGLTNFVFQIGNVELNPLDQLIDENEKLDLATIRLSEDQLKAITSEEEIGSCAFKPASWPPASLREGDYVAFGGFPGSIRTCVSFDEFEFCSWSSGGSRVSSVSDFKFYSVFERESWVASFGEKHHMDLRALGGMSGGPAFIKRVLNWELVGIVSEYQEGFDTMVFASVQAVRSDGTIEPPPV